MVVVIVVVVVVAVVVVVVAVVVVWACAWGRRSMCLAHGMPANPGSMSCCQLPGYSARHRRGHGKAGQELLLDFSCVTARPPALATSSTSTVASGPPCAPRYGERAKCIAHACLNDCKTFRAWPLWGCSGTLLEPGRRYSS